MKSLQCSDKVKYAECKKTHLEKGIKGNCRDHIGSQKKTDMVEQPEQHCMYKRVVIAVRDKAERLFKLVDAVRRHNTRILV